jgi:RNA polymerase sigma factor (sigma-70 family)
VRKGEEVRSPRAWLYRVTHNAAIDEIRRRGRMTRPIGDGVDFADVEDVRSPEPARAVIDKELADLVWSTAEVLGPDEYALLDLHVRRGLSAAELADDLGVSTGAVYTRLSRLRRSFEDALTVTLLTRRGGDECEVFTVLVSELGERVDTPQGNKLLQAHVRDCETCQANRRRFVTAAEVLAGIAPVPLIPGVQDAVWSNLSGAFDLGGPAGESGKPASEKRPRTGPSASGSPIVHAALAHPLAATALTLAIAALVAVGVWAVGAVPPEAPLTGTARDPSLVWSSTHSPGVGSSESVIGIQWSRQPDALAYSVRWSQAPTEVPDAVPDLPGSATGTTSPALAPGRWYFHLRTQGRDDSWTHTVHRGPFVVIARAGPPPDSAVAAPPESAAPPGTTDSRPPTPAGPGSAAPQGGSPREDTTPSPAAPARDSTPPSGTVSTASPASTAPPGSSSARQASSRTEAANAGAAPGAPLSSNARPTRRSPTGTATATATASPTAPGIDRRSRSRAASRWSIRALRRRRPSRCLRTASTRSSPVQRSSSVPAKQEGSSSRRPRSTTARASLRSSFRR